MPEVGEVTLEVLQAMADRHQRATAERATFILHPSSFDNVVQEIVAKDKFVTKVPSATLGQGVLYQNFTFHYDRSVLPEEVEIAKA